MSDNIESILDLKGKRIGVTKGTANECFFSMLCSLGAVCFLKGAELLNQQIKIQQTKNINTLSIGMLSEKHKNFEQLINDADNAMYLAKNNGRNRIEIVGDKSLH